MKIGVVLVTYNRLEKLKIAIKSYENQIVRPEYIMIVNNCSTDGTQQFLEEWQNEKTEIEKIVINLDKNTGGSGGFNEGLTNCLALDADWVWVADDDAYPKENAFAIAQNYIQKYPNADTELSAICGTVFKKDGVTIDCSHRRRIYTTLFSRVAQPYSKPKDYEQEEFEINGFSYVGTMINTKKLKQIPVTKKDYFIYYDDTDHSYRLSKIGKIICIPKIQVIHDAPHSEMNQIVKWKLYYLVRNTLDFIKNNFDENYFKEQCIEVPFKFKVAVFLFGKHKKYGYQMIREAVKDAKLGKTGLHDIYRPGWDPNK